MPALKNLRRIKDTATGKYLRNVGRRGYSWRKEVMFSDRNNAWDDVGTAYKAVHIERVIKDAGQSYASFLYRKDHKTPKSPLYTPYRDDYYKSSVYLEWRDADKKFNDEAQAWISEHWQELMPDTWIVEDFSVVLVPTENTVKAKDWK